jgi:hypothetical protein
VEVWCPVLTPVPTPGPVATMLLTRSSVRDGMYLSYLPWKEGGRWVPDALETVGGEIEARGLLALLEDGTVFEALQQAPVPGLAGVRAMAECGGSVAFEVARAGGGVAVVVRGCR